VWAPTEESAALVFGRGEPRPDRLASEIVRRAGVDVRALAGTTLTGLGLGAAAQPSGANRSTTLPSGSSTVA
jgi:hypothetical protein